ncbi:hypothetical protein FM036_18340 [Nostoc sp. HG1]|nr:hypothetical protein [Nostoc sp. HG1]MCL6754803.1 hypothetical protein [Nostoc sp. CCCryo 231-06]
MPKTSQLDVIMQQLDTLSLAELLAVRARVDVLIEGQSLPLGKGQPPLFRWRNPTWLRESRQNQLAQFSESEAKVDDTLEKVIGLVDEWMADESGYDEQTYPQIETSLNQNRMSV